MSKTLQCTVVGQSYVTNLGSFGSYGSAGGYAGANTYNWYVTAVKFMTPEFTGDMKKLTVGFFMKAQVSYGATHSHKLRWAICSSDKNLENYRLTYEEVDDSYKIAGGIFSEQNMNTSTMKLYYIDVDPMVLLPNTDYYMVFWGADNASLCGVGTPDNHVFTITYDETLTVQYNANGIGTPPAPQSVDPGDSITLPTMSANGYAFLGWATDPNAEVGITGRYTPTESVVLYAVWKKAFTVTFHANGVGEAPEAVIVVEGESIRLPYLSAKGYVFLGWSEDYFAAEGITGSYAPTHNVILYAIWKKQGSYVSAFLGGRWVRRRCKRFANGKWVLQKVRKFANGRWVDC